MCRRSRDIDHERSKRQHAREADRLPEAAEADLVSKKRKSAFDEAPAPGMPGAGLTPAQIGSRLSAVHACSHDAASRRMLGKLQCRCRGMSGVVLLSTPYDGNISVT